VSCLAEVEAVSVESTQLPSMPRLDLEAVSASGSVTLRHGKSRRCSASVPARRDFVRLILAPRYLGHPYALPSPRIGPNQPIAERIIWRHVGGRIPALAKDPLMR
jgi:hypothetical protein